MSDPFRPRDGVILNSASARRGRAAAPAEFGAPVGERVKFITWLMAGIIVAAVIFDIVLAVTLRLPVKAAWAVALAPLAGLLIVVPVYWYSQVLGYRVEGGELIVARRGRFNRFVLDGLEKVEIDPAAMNYSFKTFGNDGVGAITGNFRNKRLGAYEALVTDRSRAVVLRWPKQCLVVSPGRPAEFAAAVRAHAGLVS